MTQKDAISYWVKTAKDARTTARALKNNKRRHHALFFCHLAVEKLLKALVIAKAGRVPPPIHHLVRLAELSGIVAEMDEKQKGALEEINTFNIAARYDDQKLTFHRKARGRYFTRWFEESERMIKWLLARV